MKFAKSTGSRIAAFFVSAAVAAVNLPLAAFAEGGELSDDIVILYTNDVHTYIDGGLSYDVIAGIKSDLQESYENVLLVDAGDHTQGTAYGAMDKGESVIKMMNAAGYDAATLGNHEFDYGMQGCLDTIERAEFEYISCNFYHEENGVRGENVLDSYTMFDCGDEKVAFVGITTPDTFSKSTPAYFQDENGDFIYGISGGADGAQLKADIQSAINSAEESGATKIIALGHLGVDPSSAPWISEETIAGLSGLDAFIDGHSHTTMKCEIVEDKDGNGVLLTQTGEYFNRIGIMIIDAETGEISTDFIEYDEQSGTLSSELYSGTALLSAPAVKEIKDLWIEEIDRELGEVIGTAEVVFDNYDKDGNRLVRVTETNTGDFAADALYYLFDDMGLEVDAAIMNGGGIRNDAVTGDITYKTCKNINPFGNVACLLRVSGQQILDMLEWGARYVGEAENGGFLHTSGITYKIDITLPNTIQTGENEAWQAAPQQYRVYDVMIYSRSTDSWQPLDTSAYYNLAGYNYNLRNLGDGFTMFDGAENILDYVMEDYMVLANYVCAFENGVIRADNSPLLEKYPSFMLDYRTVEGSGRIEIAENIQTDDGTQSPDTGDNAGAALYIVLIISGAAIAAAAARKAARTAKR